MARKLHIARFFRRISECVLVLLVFFLAGCSEVEKEIVPPPPAPAEAAAVPELLKNVSKTSEARKFVSYGQSALPVECDMKGVLKMPSRFTGEKAVRSFWDLKIPLDLSTCTSVAFDFYCNDLSLFSTMLIYFKSGKGWYSCAFAPDEEGQWVRVEIRKSELRPEGKCEGWNKISAIRIAGWGVGEEGQSNFYIANFTPIVRESEVLVVYADSLMAKTGQNSYIRFAGTIASTLDALDIGAKLVADTDLKPKHFAGVKAVVLPYNPSIPQQTEKLLRNYVNAGGKILACYSLPKFTADILGLRLTRHYQPGKTDSGYIAGFLKGSSPLDGQPVFSPQSSWIATDVKCLKKHDVHAWWADSDRRSLGIPALIGMDNGLFLGHIWLGGKSKEQLEFMSSVMSALSPDLAKKAAVVITKRRLEEERVRKYLAELPSKKNEFRGMWCHSARGLAGRKNWDESVKFLKNNGFNVLLPNLCWGGVAFYESSVLPPSSDIAKRGDAFQECLKACRKYGVKMYPWKVCWNMGSYTSDEFERKMVKEKRTQVNRNGKANTRWLCPSHPENKKLEIEAMVELASFKPDGIHFDYIRYSGVDNCYCDGCKTRFEKEYSLSITNWPGEIVNAPLECELRRQWCDFRISNITYVVKSVSERVRKDYPEVKISAAVFRNPRTDPDTLGQDWSDWCQKGYVDSVHNMNYLESPAMFKSISRMQKKYIGKAKIYPGIGISTWSDDVNRAKVAASQIQSLRSVGIDGWTVFNFDRKAESVLPLLRLGITKED